MNQNSDIWGFKAFSRRHLYWEGTIFLLVMLMAFAVRTPYSTVAYGINGDEYEFFLMGQSVLRGHLPYMELWELKPPLMHLIMAAFAWAHSIFTMRFIQVAYMGVTAYVMYLALRRVGWGSAGLISALLYMLFMTQGDFSALAIMSEHIAALPMALLMLVLASQTLSFRGALLTGVVLGAAGLVRTNLLLLGLAAGVSILMMPQSWRTRLSNLIGLGLGTALIYGFFVLLYWINGGLDILIKTLLVAPFLVSQEMNMHWSFAEMNASMLGRLKMYHKTYFPLSWGMGISAVLLLLSRLTYQQVRYVITIVLMLICTIVSIYFSRNPWDHYTLQIMVPAAMLVPVGFFAPLRFLPRWSWIKKAALVPLLPLFMYYQLPHYVDIWKQAIYQYKIGILMNVSGPMEKIGGWLLRHGSENQPVYNCSLYTVSYVLSRSIPADGMAAPIVPYWIKFNAAFRDDPDYNLERLRDTIVKAKPKFIVGDKNGCARVPGLDAVIEKDYTLRVMISDYPIYQRNDF